MADLTEIQASQSVKLAGGDENYYADINPVSEPVSETNKSVIATSVLVGLNNTTFRKLVCNEDGHLITSGTSEILSPLPSISLTSRRALAPNASFFTSQIITEKTAIKELNVGGRVASEAMLAKYLPNVTEFVPSGDFETDTDVANWTNTGNGDSGSATWVRNTTQFVTGLSSASLTFTRSDGNHYPELSYIFPEPVDLTKWRYLRAHARVTVATGGGQSRTISIRVNSTNNTATRIWQLVGTTNTAPFNVAQWFSFVCELENPQLTIGSGVFDINRVNSISIRLQDGGNKSGTFFIDNVNFLSEIIPLSKIYSQGPTVQLRFDPVIIFDINDEIALFQRNNSNLTGEIQAGTSGVKV